MNYIEQLEVENERLVERIAHCRREMEKKSLYRLYMVKWCITCTTHYLINGYQSEIGKIEWKNNAWTVKCECIECGDTNKSYIDLQKAKNALFTAYKKSIKSILESGGIFKNLLDS
jgi:hypothetical protein